jgi:hypothetical protein
VLCGLYKLLSVLQNLKIIQNSRKKSVKFRQKISTKLLFFNLFDKIVCGAAKKTSTLQTIFWSPEVKIQTTWGTSEFLKNFITPWNLDSALHNLLWV